ncbi:MAG: glycosyltransferase family 2 protein [Limimaricola soesokkakensis]|uniref:glycosyltransferase family 2 protein n=1 Tax=Limimaricola soesokkakensis TaxID=1343159 RepID=UPI004058F167
MIPGLRRLARSLLQPPPFFSEPEAPPAPPPLSPTLVIPVKNDAEGLSRLLSQARRGRFARIVVVDDGSKPPMADLLDLSDVTLLRNDVSRGGGVARNRGLSVVETDYVLFFDADDRLCETELDSLLADLSETEDFDLCLFKYADSRVARAGGWGQPDWDERFWTMVGLGSEALCDVPRDARPILAQTANYPWNKIFRTGFLRAHGIGCAESTVHQDIPLHWLSLMAADRMLASDRICAFHEISGGSNQLHNRKGAERLQVFDVLDPVARTAHAAGEEWSRSLLAFVLGLGDWIRGRLDPAHLDAFDEAERGFLARQAGPWLDEILAADPDLARRISSRTALPLPEGETP